MPYDASPEKNPSLETRRTVPQTMRAIRGGISQTILLTTPPIEGEKISPLRKETEELRSKRDTNLPEFFDLIKRQQETLRKVTMPLLKDIAEYYTEMDSKGKTGDWNELLGKAKSNLTERRAHQKVLQKALQPLVALGGTIVLHHCMRAVEIALRNTSPKPVTKNFEEFVKRLPDFEVLPRDVKKSIDDEMGFARIMLYEVRRWEKKLGLDTTPQKEIDRESEDIDVVEEETRWEKMINSVALKLDKNYIPSKRDQSSSLMGTTGK